jgi:hypothetical protein
MTTVELPAVGRTRIRAWALSRALRLPKATTPHLELRRDIPAGTL